MRMTKKLLALLLVLTMSLALTACEGNISGQDQSQTDSDSAAPMKIRLVGLTGPTSLGMLPLVDEAHKSPNNTYQFEHVSTPDEAVAKLTSGTADIAALPTNLAASLYNKTGGAVQIAALNTLGVLYIVSNGVEISSIKDLKDKELGASGQGSTAEYALNRVLTGNELKPGTDVKITYEAEHAALATKLISGDVKLAVLPEPFVTQVTAKNKDVKVVLDIANEWKLVTGGQSELAMGCIVVRREFAEKNKANLDSFLDEYKWSAEQAVADPAAAAAIAEKTGVMNAAIAEKAIPNCNIVFIEGEEMKKSVTDFLNILFAANEKSIGGKMPGEDFFYKR